MIKGSARITDQLPAQFRERVVRVRQGYFLEQQAIGSPNEVVHGAEI